MRQLFETLTCAASWLLMAAGWGIFLAGYVLYLYILEPLSWVIEAPGSVWGGIKNQWYKLTHHGQEPGDR